MEFKAINFKTYLSSSDFLVFSLAGIPYFINNYGCIFFPGEPWYLLYYKCATGLVCKYE